MYAPSGSAEMSYDSGLVQAAQSLMTVAPRSRRHSCEDPASAVYVYDGVSSCDCAAGPTVTVGATGSVRSSV